jgi:hypothetical protein
MLLVSGKIAGKKQGKENAKVKILFQEVITAASENICSNIKCQSIAKAPPAPKNPFISIKKKKVPDMQAHQASKPKLKTEDLLSMQSHMGATAKAIGKAADDLHKQG